MKLLLIEDDKDITDYIVNIFQIAWPKAQLATVDSGRKGVEACIRETPDIILLDLGLPDIDGFDVLKEIRVFSEVPVIIITVRGEEKDIIKGLSIGADDYILKPFKLLELVARVKAVLRRSKSPAKQASLSYGPLSFKSSLRQVFYGDRLVTLTKTEGAILFELMEGRGAVVSSADMVKEIWGKEYQEIVHDIKTYIYRLRKKLEEDPRNPKLILTAPGEGYYLAKYD